MHRIPPLFSLGLPATLRENYSKQSAVKPLAPLLLIKRDGSLTDRSYRLLNRQEDVPWTMIQLRLFILVVA
jgi:hypothetical protein